MCSNLFTFKLLRIPIQNIFSLIKINPFTYNLPNVPIRLTTVYGKIINKDNLSKLPFTCQTFFSHSCFVLTLFKLTKENIVFKYIIIIINR